MKRSLALVSALLSPLLLAPVAAAESASVQVLVRAPANPAECFLASYRREADIPGPYKKLCNITSTKKTLFRGFDQTGKALSEAQQEACRCGANAILILSNSSETQGPHQSGSTGPNYGGTPGSVSINLNSWRSAETVTAIALLVSEPSAAPVPAAPPAAAIPPNEIKAGFRDLTWGSPLADAFRPIGGDDPKEAVRRFVRPTDELILAKIPVTQVAYLFAETKLCGVEIAFQKGSWGALKENLSTLWGPPQGCEDTPLLKCVWSNNAEGAAGSSAGLIVDESEIGKLILVNLELLKKAEKAKLEAESGL